MNISEEAQHAAKKLWSSKFTSKSQTTLICRHLATLLVVLLWFHELTFSSSLSPHISPLSPYILCPFSLSPPFSPFLHPLSPPPPPPLPLPSPLSIQERGCHSGWNAPVPSSLVRLWAHGGHVQDSHGGHCPQPPRPLLWACHSLPHQVFHQVSQRHLPITSHYVTVWTALWNLWPKF